MFGKWVHIAIRFWFDDANKLSTIRIYYNNNFAVDAGTGSPFVLLDEIFYTHILGAELETRVGGISELANFFHGYIYNFCSSIESRKEFLDKIAYRAKTGRVFVNTADYTCDRHVNTCGWDPDKSASENSPLPIINDSYYCPLNQDERVILPKTEICVSICRPWEWIPKDAQGNDTEECQSCSDDCVCYDGQNCNNCFDKQCKYCDKFGEGATCTECIENATKQPNGDCECDPGYSYIMA
jgi:hypothetical protein